jgi:hypothetical protein
LLPIFSSGMAVNACLYSYYFGKVHTKWGKYGNRESIQRGDDLAIAIETNSFLISGNTRLG